MASFDHVRIDAKLDGAFRDLYVTDLDHTAGEDGVAGGEVAATPPGEALSLLPFDDGPEGCLLLPQDR